MPEAHEIKESLQRELDLLTQARDELKVQMHLAKAEAKTEWAKLENTWQRVQEQIQQTRSGTEQPVKDLGSAVRNLMDELKRGYARVREQLKERHN
jgi:hypothetical protein